MPNLEAFEEKILTGMDPTLTARQIAERMVIAALEAEYGKTFTLSRNFAKMVDALSEILVTNPELRRQTLAVASTYIRKSREHQKNRTK